MSELSKQRRENGRRSRLERARHLVLVLVGLVVMSACSDGSDPTTQVTDPAVQASYDRYLAAIDGLAYGDDPADGLVRGRRFIHGRLGVAFLGAMNQFRETRSIAHDPSNTPPDYGSRLGEVKPTVSKL